MNPIQLTTARFCNRQRPDGKWAKVLAHSGPYSQFAYGTDTPSTWNRDDLQVAIIGTQESGLIPVDVDDPDWFAASLTAKYLGRQYASATRGAGFHIHLDARGIPRDNWPRTGPAGWSTGWGDIKINGFVPMPGSLHYSGEPYAATGRGALVVVQAGLIEAIQADLDAAPAREGHGGQGGTGGGRDGVMAGYVLWLCHRGLDEEDIRALWQAKADAEEDPSWPFTEDDFRRHYGSASAKYAASVAGRIVPVSQVAQFNGHAPEVVLVAGTARGAELMAASANDQAPQVVPWWDTCGDVLGAARDGEWLSQQTFEPVFQHIEGLVLEGFTLLAAAPKSGKSRLALGWLLDQAESGHPVFYLSLEDNDRRMKTRCDLMLGGRPIPKAFTYLTEIPPHLTLAAIAQFVDRHKNDAPLVVLDTLGKAMMPAARTETTYERDYRLTGALQGIVKPVKGAALIAIHHDRKATSDDFVDKASGTRGITGAADTIMVLTRKRNEPEGLLMITGRDIDESEYALDSGSDARWKLAGGSLASAAVTAGVRKSQAGLQNRSASILACVTERPDGVTAEEVAKAVDTDKATATTYLSRLVDSGRLKRLRPGVYAPVRSVISYPPGQPGNNRITVITQPDGGTSSPPLLEYSPERLALLEKLGYQGGTK